MLKYFYQFYNQPFHLKIFFYQHVHNQVETSNLSISRFIQVKNNLFSSFSKFIPDQVEKK